HQVSAQLVYEPFDYGSAAVGTNLANLTGGPSFSGYTNPVNGVKWVDMQNTTAGPTEIQISGTGNLAMPTGLEAANGNSGTYGAANTTSARSARVQITPGAFTSGTVYYSLSFTIPTTSTAPASTGAGAFFAVLTDSAGTTTSSPSG